VKKHALSKIPTSIINLTSDAMLDLEINVNENLEIESVFWPPHFLCVIEFDFVRPEMLEILRLE